MVRTQVYLEESASKALRSIALKTGRKQSELIREAIDKLILGVQDNNPRMRLQKAKVI
jgi:predicted DNA-binding protein